MARATVGASEVKQIQQSTDDIPGRTGQKPGKAGKTR